MSNAGAHGKELKDDLVSIEVLTAEGKIEDVARRRASAWLPDEQLQGAWQPRPVAARGYPERGHHPLSGTPTTSAKRGCAAYLEERQAKQPQGKSAGSTFKNPPGYSAGYLIEQVGMKGERYGQAQFSPKHANFMMNLGGATAADVLHLMDLARPKVREQFGIELEPEIEFVGD